MYVHPAAVHGVYASRAVGEVGPNPRDPRRLPGEWSDYPPEVLAAISRGELADDLSLWVAVIDAMGQPDPEFDPVWLRSTARSDGSGGTGQSVAIGFDLPGTTRIVFFQLVHHPLHDIVHPFEAKGLVTRLWPNPPDYLDLESHAVLDKNTRLGGVFLDGKGMSEHLSPDRRATGNGLPDYLT
ncbi:hypothetical protein ACFO5K_22715 [Nocardia halotolerans]|uniref:Uncharacterized protein n=1 Tax=Nocardia halotolerans TaxID=1755878 RepID=A0ABV8VPQ4_9NOCA